MPGELPDSTFERLLTTSEAGGADAALASLAEDLRKAGRHHDLFDVRLMQARRQNGLPAITAASLDELPEPLRNRMEEAYLAACREIGELLLDEHKIREAWMYLRPLGNRTEVAAALERLVGGDEDEQIIEVALHEGVAPRLGFRLVLQHYGVCNAISMFDAEMPNRPKADRQGVAGLLVEHIHEELLDNVKADIARQQGSPAKEATLGALVADRDWLFAEDNYHLDTTHLASIVRFALGSEDPATLRLALDLTEYGRRLAPNYQFPGDEPFRDLYPAAALFFRAQLGEGVDEAVDYFRQKAETLPFGEVGSMPAEVYISLLSRLGRHREAMDATARLLAPGVRASGFAPSLLELARSGGAFDRLMEISRDRGDPIGFLAGLCDRERSQA